MSCSKCNNPCGRCNPCGDDCEKACCKNPCLQWGFDGCYLRGRCADGTELNPLDLCAWLDEHETCTSFRLVPNGEGGSYIEYLNECDESQKIYVCDFLSLGSIGCLGDVKIIADKETGKPKSCSYLVYDPECGVPGSATADKWTNYHIPDAGDCVVEMDDDGYYRVLVKDGCGCIKECRMLPSDTVYEYSLRDAWPNDPDWPFSVGSRMGDNSEIIDLMLDQKVPIFGKTDLEVTVQYAYGIQNTTPAGQSSDEKNFKSMVVPTKTPTHTPSVTDMLQNTWTVQGVNAHPWGSAEWQVSRTVLVPKGEKLYLTHTIEVRMLSGSSITFMPYGGESDTPSDDSSRLHALRVVVKAAKGVKL